MPIEQDVVERIFERNGFIRNRSTKKVVEYESDRSGKIVYLRVDVGLPNYIRVVIHPDEIISSLISVHEVKINTKNEFQHGSNMIAFPKRINGGKNPIHYGRALNIDSLTALSDFSVAFHNL